LDFRQSRDALGGDVSKVQEFGGLEPAMPGKDDAVLVDDDKAKKPWAKMLFAIWRICFLECFRAFRRLIRSVSIGSHSTFVPPMSGGDFASPRREALRFFTTASP
jgi:hypothetical protein